LSTHKHVSFAFSKTYSSTNPRESADPAVPLSPPSDKKDGQDALSRGFCLFLLAREWGRDYHGSRRQ